MFCENSKCVRLVTVIIIWVVERRGKIMWLHENNQTISSVLPLFNKVHLSLGDGVLHQSPYLQEAVFFFISSPMTDK